MNLRHRSVSEIDFLFFKLRMPSLPSDRCWLGNAHLTSSCFFSICFLLYSVAADVVPSSPPMDQETLLNVGKPKLILSQGLVGTDTALSWSGVSSWSLLSLACVFINVLQKRSR